MNYLIRIYSGRLNRKRYLLGLLLCIGCMVITGMAVAVLLGALKGSPARGSIAILGLMFTFLPVYVAHVFSLHVRRLHDLGKSGWYALLFPLPVIGLIVLVYLLAKKGQETPNRFGEVPSSETKLMNALLNQI